MFYYYIYLITSLIKHHPFKVLFFEDFEDKNSFKRWIPTSYSNYTGIWEIGETDLPQTEDHEVSLILRSKKSYSAVSTVFKNPISNINKTLVIQYEMRPQLAFTCSGAYMKLYSNINFDPLKLSNETKYSIMFGPDRCGTNNKIQFIFNHWNPIKKEFEEISLKDPPKAPVDQLSHLYTLIIRSNNTFNILLDNNIIKNGSLYFDFKPSIVPPTLIPDLNDKKPENWDDIPYIVDPNFKKPENWEEEFIYDNNKLNPPIGWNLNEPLEIPDPLSKKPIDWDNNLLGEWISPTIPNPKCQIGCGKYIPPKIKNPNYKGEFKYKLIKNPNYKGEWKPKMIKNPNFYYDQKPYQFNLTALGFEIWATNKNLAFDHILISFEENEIINWNKIDFLKRKNYQLNSLNNGLKKEKKKNTILLKDKKFLKLLKESLNLILNSIFPIELTFENLFIFFNLILPILIIIFSKICY